MEHHNVLSKVDLIKLYGSRSLSVETPKEYKNRLVFTIGVLTAMRPNAMSLIKRSQFIKMEINNEILWKF